jgi:pyruvate kinase
MNFSHGSYEYHQSVIDNTRAMVARALHFLASYPSSIADNPLFLEDPEGRPVAIALDTVRLAFRPSTVLVF